MVNHRHGEGSVISSNQYQFFFKESVILDDVFKTTKDNISSLIRQGNAEEVQPTHYFDLIYSSTRQVGYI